MRECPVLSQQGGLTRGLRRHVITDAHHLLQSLLDVAIELVGAALARARAHEALVAAAPTGCGDGATAAAVVAPVKPDLVG